MSTNPGTITKDPTLGAEWAYIPPGKFLMGSPEVETGHEADEAQHEVKLSHWILIKCTPVTQKEYETLMVENPSGFKESSVDAPVESISWYDAAEYCNALSKKEGFGPAYRIDGKEVEFLGLDSEGYRLPTAAEWEYACRAGTRTAFWNGDCIQPEAKDPNLDRIGWYWGNSGEQTHPVGEKPANPWGLHDMHGNVTEWCQDWSGDFPKRSAADPMGLDEGWYRDVRGGSWRNSAEFCRAARLNYLHPKSRYNDLGFRVCRSVHLEIDARDEQARNGCETL
jgi:formylglycine-generating enzyme required for sulfatase activity